MTSISPTSSNKRIDQLDIFRGFAIYGIFMVNILVMNCSFLYRSWWESIQVGIENQAAMFILENFFYSKFFPIFSFLFGIGVALQFRKMTEQSTFSYSFFVRRFGALLLFGVCHILFLWSGDILNLYAMIGFLMLLLVNRSTRFVLWSAIFIFLFPFARDVFQGIMSYFDFDSFASLEALDRLEIIELKRNGSFWSGISLRIKEAQYLAELLYGGMAQTAFSMAILGMYLVKKGFIDNLSAFAKKIQVKFLVIAFILISLKFVIRYYIWPTFEIERGSLLSISIYTLFILGEVTLALLYLWIFTKLFQIRPWKSILSPLRHVGKMAFTNYILQSVFGYILMRVFGLYETFNPFQMILLVTGFFVFQIFISKWWLSKFRFGPLEWIWRMISYWKKIEIIK